MKAPPCMLSGNAAWLIDGACIMGGATEIRAMAPAATILTFCQGLAVLDIMVVGAAP